MTKTFSLTVCSDEAINVTLPLFFLLDNPQVFDLAKGKVKEGYVLWFDGREVERITMGRVGEWVIDFPEGGSKSVDRDAKIVLMDKQTADRITKLVHLITFGVSQRSKTE